MLPRLATPRTLSRPTDGAAGAFIAHLHRRPWIPWQRLAFDVAGERLPDGTYAYPIVVITVPRQCGKTTGIFDALIGRGIEQPDYRAAYAAQTGHVTTERFGDRIQELEGGLLGDHMKLRRSQGTERITVRATQSYIKAFPPKDGALRSSALDGVVVDEAQEHDEALGRALDTTIIPTFTTRARRQLMLVGTAGTDNSQYLARYLAAARDGTPGYAVIEYGAHDGEDTDDEDVWTRRHPGLAGGLTDLAALRTARAALGRAGFAREYMNVWSRTSTTVISPEQWSGARATSDMPAGRVCLSVDVSVDRESAAIGVCGPGRYLELIESRPGVDWITARALELQQRWDAPIVADSVGPTGTVHDALKRAGADLLTPTAQDVANACADLLDDLAGGTATIRHHPDLDAAVAVAALRNLRDGKAWDRRGSVGSIAPLVAITNAAWGYGRLPDLPRRPAVSSGRT